MCSDLALNTTLEKFSIWNSDLTDSGAEAIATLLEKNGTIKYMWLCENEGVGEKGAMALVEALNKNQSLQSLYMKGTNVPVEVQQRCIKRTLGRMEF